MLWPWCPVSVVAVSGQYTWVAITNPPKLLLARASGRVSSGNLLRVVQLAGVANTWKPTRRKSGPVQAGTMVEVLEDLIVVEAPDLVWVARPIEEMKLHEGDTILRFARLWEGWADLWANGCWYKQGNADFIVEPDGAGCGGDRCSAKVTKMGSQMGWFHIKLANGKTGGP